MEIRSPLLRGVLGTIHATVPQSPTAWPSFVNQKKKKSFRFYMARNIPSFGIELSRALAFFLLPRLYNRMNSLLGICVEKM